MFGLFHFKQFSVDQANCAMKINTDGVLLGTLAEAENPKRILDVGTGTGVVALMLAQRFSKAVVDAVEIDKLAAETAEKNFAGSPFASRLNCFPVSFQEYFSNQPRDKFDLIVSNPPFFINSLKNPDPNKTTARHTDKNFFEKLIQFSASHLSNEGCLWLILPEEIFEHVTPVAIFCSLKVNRIINIKSFSNNKPHRFLIKLKKQSNKCLISDFVIYEIQKKYSQQYEEALKPFFTIF